MKLHDKKTYDAQRKEMIKTQLIPRGIKNAEVLTAFQSVQRDFFVLPEFLNEAYFDGPLPLMLGQTISQPYIVAFMTELLELPQGKSAKILEIGTGSGYQSAILAAMGHCVTSIERLEKLAEFARRNLDNFSYGDKVTIHVADGTLGWPDNAPYDGILVTAAAPNIPQKLIEQLAEGGKLVIPCGDLYIQQMFQVTKSHDGKLEINKNIGCQFVPLIGGNGFH